VPLSTASGEEAGWCSRDGSIVTCVMAVALVSWPPGTPWASPVGGPGLQGLEIRASPPPQVESLG
jgi:hypothetical protein